jgi:hypothetical protein
MPTFENNMSEDVLERFVKFKVFGVDAEIDSSAQQMQGT